MEITAMSQLYNVNISVSQLSKSGQLETYNSTPEALEKGLQPISLVRHRGVHYNWLTRSRRALPLPNLEGSQTKSEMDSILDDPQMSCSNHRSGETNLTSCK